MTQNFELSAQTLVGVASSQTIQIRRGVLPGGGVFDPAPVAELVVVGRHTGTEGVWRVALRGAGGLETLAEVEFPAGGLNPPWVLSEPVVIDPVNIWPGPGVEKELRDLRLIRGLDAGTFDLKKAYLRIRQEGRIVASVGRAPMAVRQTEVTETEFTRFENPVLFEYWR